MPKEVFISHSSEDHGIAERICELLEERGLNCWIAPRDVAPGSRYGEAIVDAIETCIATVLILSEHANDSVYVQNEIERAVSKGKPVFPVRVRQVQPSKALELFVSSSQWIDAWSPPLEQKLDQLAAAIVDCLGKPGRPSHPRTRTRRPAWMAHALTWAVGIALLAGGIFGVNYLSTHRKASPGLPPLVSDEIETLRAQSFDFAARIRGGLGPAAASVHKPQLKSIADKIAADPRYDKQAPREAALIYRLYAATLLFTQSSAPLTPIRDAQPWIDRAVQLDPSVKDYAAFKESAQFLAGLAAGKSPSVNMSTLMKHEFRVAMPEASDADVAKQSAAALEMVKCLLDPSKCGSGPAGGSSARDDFEYLAGQKLGTVTVATAMEAMRMKLLGTFPNVDVGGRPMYGPLPNGNTKVSYRFSNGRNTLAYEWEVNKAKLRIVPLNAATRELMTLKVNP